MMWMVVPSEQIRHLVFGSDMNEFENKGLNQFTDEVIVNVYML